MPTYRVVSGDVEVYRYTYDHVLDFAEWPAPAYTHVEVVEPAPGPAPAPSAPTRITKLAFRNRFTAAEKTALELAALHDSAFTTTHPKNLLAAGLRASMADQRDASYIDLARADTRSGVMTLEQVGILAAGRALEILDTPPADAEVFNA